MQGLLGTAPKLSLSFLVLVCNDADDKWALRSALSHFTLQIFALLDVGEQIAEESPAVLERLPQQLLSMRRKVLLDFVTETRATFAAFCVSLSQDLQRHSGQTLHCPSSSLQASKQSPQTWDTEAIVWLSSTALYQVDVSLSYVASCSLLSVGIALLLAPEERR